jgi:hypothetical protein
MELILHCRQLASEVRYYDPVLPQLELEKALLV